MSQNKILGYFGAALTIALGIGILIPSASAEILYDREGIRLRGSARIVSRNAATCNVLEEKYSPEEYEELKANQGRPLHVWQLDFSAHNNTGRTLDFLQANFDIQAPQAPCTNWSGEGPGRGPAGGFTDLQGNRGFVEPAGVSFKGLSRVSAMGAGEVARDRMFMLVFHEYEPVFKRWSVNFNFAAAGSGESAAAASDRDPPGEAARPRLQLPPDILADKYLRQAEQIEEENDYEGARKAMEELLALQQEHGLEPAPEDHFRYAQIWSAAGASEKAIEAAVRYLQIRGREAEHYDDALDLINRAKGRQSRGESGPAAAGGGRPGSTGIRVGVARHAGERVGVGGGLVGLLSGRSGDRPWGAWFKPGTGPGVSRRQLDRPRQVLPVGGSQRVLAGRPQLHPGLPPAEGGEALGSVTLLPLVRCCGEKRGRETAKAGAGPGGLAEWLLETQLWEEATWRHKTLTQVKEIYGRRAAMN